MANLSSVTAPTAQRPLAAIFDMDGTLVDNMGYHVQAWTELATRLGADVPPERFARDWAGWKADEIIPRVLGRPAAAEEVERLSEEKEVRYRALYGPVVRALPGLGAFVDRLRAAGLRLAVATAAPAENRALVLGGLRLGDAFDAVIGPEHAARGKPAPDIFLAAGRALGVDPARAVVFEDAPNGIRAAIAAGMIPVGLTTTVDAAALEAAGARYTAPDYRALPAPLLRLLLPE